MGSPMIITERLELIPASIELTQAALEGKSALQKAVAAQVPESWPPEYLDTAALQFTLERLEEGAEQSDWWLYFVVRTDPKPGRVLIGGVGYKGPPSTHGEVEVGYGIVREHQRMGYASEAVRG